MLEQLDIIIVAIIKMEFFNNFVIATYLTYITCYYVENSTIIHLRIYRNRRYSNMSSEKLKNTGLKITNARLAIFGVFEQEQDKHLSAYNIQDSLKQANIEISLATIYRVLGQFEEAGLLQRHEFDDEKALYELHDGEHHDHMVCNKCSRVIDFVDGDIDKRKGKVLDEHNFLMSGHRLVLYGTCSDCR